MIKSLQGLLLLLSLTISSVVFGETIEGEATDISIVKQEFKIGGKRFKLGSKVIIEELYNQQQKYTLAQIQPGSVLRVEYSSSKVTPIRIIKAYVVPQ